MIKTEYNLFVHGIPRPQPRPRMTKTGHVYTPKTVDSWKTAVKMAVFLHGMKPTITDDVSVIIDFYLPASKNNITNAYHISKPDIDNLIKSILDSLTEINVWNDDCQVCHLVSRKLYCSEKNKAGADIIIQRIKEQGR